MINKLLITLLSCLLCYGCSSGSCGHKHKYKQKIDGAPPKKISLQKIDKISNAKPKAEPKSKIGNPKSYVVFKKKYNVMKSSSGYKKTGYASWYGNKFHGYKTANGEVYDMYQMTAAHKTLPLPSYVKVKNLANGKSIIVKVNDRGPFHSDRILDLSYAAAAKLDMLHSGITKVEIIALK